jgi:hypothetical protein
VGWPVDARKSEPATGGVHCAVVAPPREITRARSAVAHTCREADRGGCTFRGTPELVACWWSSGATVLAFVLQPGWLREWRHAIETASPGATGRFPYTAPITQPGGLLTLLALLRWRRPEARLLATLACVPQTTLPYEGVLRFLVPRGWRQMLMLTVLRWSALSFVRAVHQLISLTQNVMAYAPTMTSLLYLPCTVMILRRANEGAVPLWLERRVAAWPRWIKGETIDAG